MRLRFSFHVAVLTLLSIVVVVPALGSNRVLTVMDWKIHETQQTQAWFEYVKHRFEDGHPGVTIEYVSAPWGAPYNERIITGAMAGSAPDVVSLSVLWARDLYELGMLLPLNDLIEKTPSMAPSEFIPSTQFYNQKDGEIFGIATAMDSATLMYDLDAFEEVGLDTDPYALQSWDEFLIAAKKLTMRTGDQTTRYGYAGPINAELFGAWLVANGSSYYTDDLKQSKINAPEAIETAHFINELNSLGVLGGYFRSANAAMGYGITSHPYFLAQESPELRFNMTTYPQGPSGSGRGTITWGNMLSITRNSPNVDLAWSFISYYAGLEGNIDIYEFLGYASSPRLDFYQSTVWRLAQSEQTWLTMIPELALVGGVYPFLRGSEFGSQIWSPLMGPALRGERAVEGAFSEAERLYNQILAE